MRMNPNTKKSIFIGGVLDDDDYYERLLNIGFEIEEVSNPLEELEELRGNNI